MRLAACIGVVGLAGLLLGTPAWAAQKLTFYSHLTQKGFLNNTDDLARGEGKNPFGNYGGPNVPTSTSEAKFGPFPGDEGEFEFDLHPSASSSHTAGSAIFNCQYGFAQSAFCDAAFQLDGGTIFAKGSYGFSASTYVLAIVGGTGTYRNVRGSVAGAALGRQTQPQPIVRAVPMLQDQHLSLNVLPGSKRNATTLTTYSAPVSEAFVGNIDDEVRGDANNPYGTHSKPPSVSEKNNGPFPGDEALFSFDVYKSSGLDTKTGSATYTCWYYFDRNAFCDATFQLKGGTLVAFGTLNFDAKTFELAVTGGDGTYANSTGVLVATPGGKTAQRLAFVLK